MVNELVDKTLIRRSQQNYNQKDRSTMPGPIEVYFDGAITINPGGKATYGVYILEGINTVFNDSGVVGDGNNMSVNVAEYHALIKGLDWLIKNKYTDNHIVCYGDSQLVINQMNKTWKIKKGIYKEKAKQAEYLVNAFKNINFNWLPREENYLADELSKVFQ